MARCSPSHHIELAPQHREWWPLLTVETEANGDLKVHKNENFFGFDVEFCPISLLFMHK